MGFSCLTEGVGSMGFSSGTKGVGSTFQAFI